MAGYTPLFSSLTTGTLCGRWPDIGLWPIVLSLADRHGVVDVTPDYLARVTGLSTEAVAACMQRFCEPDRDSRSAAEDGRRLVLLEPDHRDWGWRVVNHGVYRERARKQQWDLERTASGRNAERMRISRERSSRLNERSDVCRDVPTSSDGARSQTQTQTQTQTEDSRVSEDRDSRPPKRTRERPQYESAEFHQAVIAAYHEALPDLPAVKAWSKQRAGALNARIRERLKQDKPADAVDYWRKLFAQVSASDFLCGRAGEFRADLEWILRPENFLKVIEGRYGNRSGRSRNGESSWRAAS